jgi:hemerythrin-like domain-containing protein
MYENSMALCVTDKCTFRRDKHGASSHYGATMTQITPGFERDAYGTVPGRALPLQQPPSASHPTAFAADRRYEPTVAFYPACPVTVDAQRILTKRTERGGGCDQRHAPLAHPSARRAPTRDVPHRQYPGRGVAAARRTLITTGSIPVERLAGPGPRRYHRDIFRDRFPGVLVHDMTRDTATRILREEHRLILRVLDSFEKLLQRDELPVAALEDSISFFRLFTDACHHGKEEDLLFTALESEDVPGVAGPIGMLRAEHVEGRALVGRLAGLLAAHREGDAAAAPEFRREARDYIESLRAHIAKEDEGVFQLADEELRGVACSNLCDAYDALCSRRFEGRTLQDLETLAARLTAVQL